MFRRSFALLMGVACLAACNTINEDNYASKVVEALCEKNSECYEEYFAEYWDDVDACIADLEDYFYFDDEEYADCTFQKGNAKTCLNWFDGLSCSEFESGEYEYEDACEEIWDC